MLKTRTRRGPARLLLATPRGVTTLAVTGTARLVAAGLLAAIGVIHLALAPVYYEAAAYVGVGFYVTFAVAMLAALAIVVGLRGAWVVGGLIAAGALVALILSTTVGLPGFVDTLSAPWAMLSLVLEGSFVVLYVALAVVRRNLLLAPR